jgi:hypothetical protein
MNFYASSVALLWTTAMRLGGPRAEAPERIAPNRRVRGRGERPCPRVPIGPPGLPSGPCERCYFWSE